MGIKPKQPNNNKELSGIEIKTWGKRTPINA